MFVNENPRVFWRPSRGVRLEPRVNPEADAGGRQRHDRGGDRRADSEQPTGGSGQPHHLVFSGWVAECSTKSSSTARAVAPRQSALRYGLQCAATPARVSNVLFAPPLRQPAPSGSTGSSRRVIDPGRSCSILSSITIPPRTDVQVATCMRASLALCGRWGAGRILSELGTRNSELGTRDSGRWIVAIGMTRRSKTRQSATFQDAV